MSDQMIEITGTEQAMFQMVDKTIKRAVKMGDLSIVVDRIKALRREGQMTGLALAKLLYEWKLNCEYLGIDPADFDDAVLAETGLAHQTTRKYTSMWESIFVKSELPDHLLAKLIGHPVKTLLLVAPAAKEEQLEEEDWEYIAAATDEKQVRDYIHDIRGGRTSSKNAITLRVTRDGAIEARRGDGPYVPVGYLALKKREEDELVDAAISRIIRASGIQEQ